MKKKMDTHVIDENRNAHDGGSNSFRRFHIGDTLTGYLEKKLSGRYVAAGAQAAIFPRLS